MGIGKRNKIKLPWYGYGLVLKTQVRVRDGYGSKLKYWCVDGSRYVMIFKVSTGTERIRDNLKNGIRVRNPYPSPYFRVWSRYRCDLIYADVLLMSIIGEQNVNIS